MKKAITTSFTTQEFSFIQSRTFGRSVFPLSPSASTVKPGTDRKRSASPMKGSACH